MRHTAFKRGIAYLERYCLLIAFAAFLERAQVPSLCAAVLHAMDQCQWGPGLGVKTGACFADISSTFCIVLLSTDSTSDTQLHGALVLEDTDRAGGLCVCMRSASLSKDATISRALC